MCFLAFSTARTSIASFLYQLYCQRECVCVRWIYKKASRIARRRQVFHLMQTDRFFALAERQKTQKNKIKLQNSNQLISARFISSFFLLFVVVSAMLLFSAVSYSPYISNTYFRRKAPCEKYFAFRTSMYLYVQVLLYANKQYGIFVMFEFNFFVFNLSPWPFLDRGNNWYFFFNFVSLYLVVEEILIKFYSVCQHCRYIYGCTA